MPQKKWIVTQLPASVRHESQGGNAVCVLLLAWPRHSCVSFYMGIALLLVALYTHSLWLSQCWALGGANPPGPHSLESSFVQSISSCLRAARHGVVRMDVIAIASGKVPRGLVLQMPVAAARYIVIAKGLVREPIPENALVLSR